MRKLISIIIVAAALVLAGCNGSDMARVNSSMSRTYHTNDCRFKDKYHGSDNVAGVRISFETICNSHYYKLKNRTSSEMKCRITDNGRTNTVYIRPYSNKETSFRVYRLHSKNHYRCKTWNSKEKIKRVRHGLSLGQKVSNGGNAVRLHNRFSWGRRCYIKPVESKHSHSGKKIWVSLPANGSSRWVYYDTRYIRYRCNS